MKTISVPHVCSSPGKSFDSYLPLLSSETVSRPSAASTGTGQAEDLIVVIFYKKQN